MVSSLKGPNVVFVATKNLLQVEMRGSWLRIKQPDMVVC